MKWQYTVTGDYVWVRDVSDKDMKRDLDSNSMPAQMNLDIGTKVRIKQLRFKRFH